MIQYTRILCLGDSITYGARAQHGRTYPLLLEEMLCDQQDVPAICLNAGVNGERSWEIVSRAWNWLGSDEWVKVVIAMFGTNDSKPGSRTPLVLYRKQWDRLYRFCTFTQTRLIACEIPWIDPTGQPEYDVQSLGWINKANADLYKWCDENSVPMVRGIYDDFRQSPKLLADGIHPTNIGNQAIADSVYSRIAQPLPAPNGQ